MKTREVKTQTALATKWSAITEIVARIASPVTNMILARILTPDAFGVVATAAMVTSFADVFSDAGLQKYLIHHEFSDGEELDRHTNVAFTVNLFISAFLFGLIALFNAPIAELVGDPGLGLVIVVASLSIPITAFSGIQMARFKREFAYRTLFFIRLCTMLIPFSVTIPLALVTKSYWALVLGTLASNLANAIILTCTSKWKPHFSFRADIFREMFSYSGWILLESIAVWLTSYIGTFIVGRHLDSYYVGLYKTSMSTVDQITVILTSATMMPLFTAISRLKDRKPEMESVYRKYMRAIGLIAIPLGAGIFLYRGLITEVLLGDQWTEAADFIGLWGLTGAFTITFSMYCNWYFNAQGKVRLSFFSQICHLAVLVPLLIVFADSGYETIFRVRSFVRFEGIAVNLLFMAIFTKFPVHKLLLDLVPVFLGTAVMSVAGYFLVKYLPGMLGGFAGVAICILIYGAFMLLLFRKRLVEVLETFGIVKSKTKEEPGELAE